MVRTVLVCCLTVSLAACGDDGGGSGADAAPTADAKPIARVDHPMVMSSVRLPTDETEVGETSMVFPGTNNRKVNKLGGLTTVLLGLTDCLEIQNSIDMGIESGETLHMYLVNAAPLGEDDPAATATFAFVEDADSDPTNTLTGTGQVRMADGESLRHAATLSIEGTTVSGTGAADAPVTWLLKMLDTADPMPTPGVYARIEGTITSDGFTGVIGSAITPEQFQSDVYPGIAAILTAALARCPDPDRTQVSGIYDTNQDDVVTVEELLNNDQMASLSAPDVDLDGDGTNDHISQGAYVELVPVELVD